MRKGGKSEGWKVEKLGDICEVFADGDWIESKDQSPEGVRLIQTGNVGNGVFKDRGEKARYISEATFKRLRCTEIFEGDCLVSRLPEPVGRACILPDTGEKMITAVDCTIIRFDTKKVIPEFFNYYSQSDQYVNDVDHETSGTTRKRISRSKLAEIEIPIPSLPEQQRIVSVLDEAFASIAQAKSNAERNLVNARELCTSISESIFAKPNQKWRIEEFGTVIDVLTDFHANGSYKTLRDNYELLYEEDFALMVRSTDFENDFQNDKRYISEKSYEFLSKSKVYGGEIIISKIGNAGKVYLMPKISRPCSLGLNLFLIRTNDKKANNEYIYHYLHSNHGKFQIKSRLNGTTTKTITKENVRNIKIPFPPLAEQRAIVGRLEALSAETGRLEEIYQQKVESLEELKKSVLAKAFEGNL